MNTAVQPAGQAKGKAVKIIVGVVNGKVAAALVSRLEASAPGQAFAAFELPAGSEQLEQRLADAPQANLFLSHVRPELAILESLSAGGEVLEALQQWEQAAASMLQVWRKNRKRTFMVDATAAFGNPKAFSSALHARLGLSLPEPALQDAMEQQAFDELHQLIAAQCVAQSARAQELIAELEAASVPLGEASLLPEVDFEGLLERLNKSKTEREALQAQRTDIEEENELLLLQLHQVQEELEHYYLENQQAEKVRKTLESDLSSSVQERKRLEKDLKANRQVLEKARKQSAQLSHRNGLLESRLETVSKQLARLQNRFAAVRASTSWRLTAPLRAFRRLFKRKPVASVKAG